MMTNTDGTFLDVSYDVKDGFNVGVILFLIGLFPFQSSSSVSIG